MKLWLILILWSFSALAINPQEGGGGNVCVPIWHHVTARPRLIEEVRYVAKKRFRFFQTIAGDKIRFTNTKRVFPGKHIPELSRTNLLKTNSGQWVLEYMFDKLESDRFPDKREIKLRNELNDLYQILSDVYVVDLEFKNYYMANPSDFAICHPSTIKAAMITKPNGAIILSAPTWNRLSTKSQMLLVLHEVVRLAQMFRPWMSALNNDELYELVDSIYVGRRVSQITSKYTAFYENLYEHLDQVDVNEKLAKFETELTMALMIGSPIQSLTSSFNIAEMKNYLERYSGWKSFNISNEVLKLKNNPRYYIPVEESLIKKINYL